jgi:hypothetical protein
MDDVTFYNFWIIDLLKGKQEVLLLLKTASKRKMTPHWQKYIIPVTALK